MCTWDKRRRTLQVEPDFVVLLQYQQYNTNHRDTYIILELLERSQSSKSKKGVSMIGNIFPMLSTLESYHRNTGVGNYLVYASTTDYHPYSQGHGQSGASGSYTKTATSRALYIPHMPHAL